MSGRFERGIVFIRQGKRQVLVIAAISGANALKMIQGLLTGPRGMDVTWLIEC